MSLYPYIWAKSGISDFGIKKEDNRKIAIFPKDSYFSIGSGLTGKPSAQYI